LEKETKNFIQDDLEKFLVQKSFYKELGLPFKRGYLLSGKPGTGKTSLIYTMSCTLKRDLYYVNLKQIEDDMTLNKMMSSVPSKSIIVFEDIDCQSDITHKRDQDIVKVVSKKSNDDKNMSLFTLDKLTLSSLLGCLDGYILSDEQIIIMTTNYPEKLDKALIRPGRMDVHLAFYNCTNYQIQEMFEVVTNSKVQLNLNGVKEKTISPCKASNFFVQYKDASIDTVQVELKKLSLLFQNK
jgi:ATP-dependent 26S proteasome regulatory subunit